MKRGRPNIRRMVQSKIMGVLSTSQYPLTTSSLTKLVSKDLNKTISWNTVQKYLNEMVQKEEVNTIKLPHSKIDDKDGLVMYVLKK